MVGVIIPMYNASATIEATLASVCAQTHRNLDIIVVDDGSTDDSAVKVRTLTEHESRLRLLHQPNSGVAAARNLGAASTTADYLAFIDADDLWAPAKIELQLKALVDSPETVGLVYCWYAHIDHAGRVYSLTHKPEAEGWVLRSMLQTNVVGNGSSAMFKRAAFERAGGFDPSPLRDGCEDLSICLHVAESYEFRLIKRHLVGYRVLPQNKSSDATKMVRSCAAVLSEFRVRYPEFDGEMDEHLDDLRFWLMVRAASAARYDTVRELAVQMWKSNPRTFLLRLPKLLFATSRARTPRGLKELIRLVRPRPRYLEESW